MTSKTHRANNPDGGIIISGLCQDAWGNIHMISQAHQANCADGVIMNSGFCQDPRATRHDIANISS